MICKPCQETADQGVEHVGCLGETWCDCQHKPPRLLFVPTVRNPAAPIVGELAAGVELTGPADPGGAS